MERLIKEDFPSRGDLGSGLIEKPFGSEFSKEHSHA
jgi:hypothetical protein